MSKWNRMHASGKSKVLEKTADNCFYNFPWKRILQMNLQSCYKYMLLFFDNQPLIFGVILIN